MCLYVEQAKTNAFKPKKGKKIEVYKQIKIREVWDKVGLTNSKLIGYKLVTPHRQTDVEAGWFKPEKAIDKFTSNTVHGGAIHAYTRNLRRYNGGMKIILKCQVYEEDVIAFGRNGEIAVKRLWIPLEEIERATKLMKRRGFKV